MLKKILSISGKPGLYQLVSNGKNMIIVESLPDKRKMPVYARDRVVSLGDISIYTNDDEIPLKDVLAAIKNKENGQQAIVKPENLRKYFGEVLPSYDRDRVYDHDIKKIISWYNTLLSADIDFEQAEEIDENKDANAVEGKAQ